MNELVFCESRADAERALAERDGNSRLVVALAPAAAARLRRAGRTYVRIEDVYPEEEVCGGCAAQLERLTQWADWIDDCLRTRVPEFASPRFPAARLHFFFLAWLTNALAYRAHALTWLAEELGAAHVVCPYAESPSSGFESDLGYWTSNVSLWSLVIPAWARSRKLDVRVIPPTESTVRAGERQPEVPTGPRAMLERQRLLLVREGWSEYVRYAWGRLSARLASRKGRVTVGAVLFLHEGYDVGPVRAALERQGQPCVSWRDVGLGSEQAPAPALRARLQAAWEELHAEPALREPFVIDGVDVWTVAAPRLQGFFVDVVPRMHRHFEIARRVFIDRRPAAVVTPYAEAVWQAPALEAARSLGIPTFVYQHGGFNGACEYAIWPEIDRYVADHLLVYGDGVKAYLDEDDARRGPARARTIVVGSARLDALRRRPSPRVVRAIRRRAGARGPSDPVVLYVPCMLRGNYRHLVCDDYPDVRFYELQSRLITLFREFPGVRFLYKAFHNQVTNPVLAEIEEAENVRAIGYLERRVTSLMWAADLVILDFPGTALLECLLTSKPLIVYADARSIRMRAEAKVLLRRRCRFAEEPEAFLLEVRTALERREFADVAQRDDAFLRAYGTHLDDGRSAERAAAAIMDVAGLGRGGARGMIGRYRHQERS